MKKSTLILISLIFIVVTNVISQNWGMPVIFDSVTPTYGVYSKKISLGDTAFLVTDLRAGDRYEEIESYEVRTLTIYRAFDGTQYFRNQPVVYFVHGGAWIDEYAAWYKFVAQSFTGEMGWITAIVDYRLTSDSVFIADQYCPNRNDCFDVENRKKAAWYPDNIHDLADGLQWLCDSIDTNGGDAENIILFGHSAGGHLAGLLATHEIFAEKRPAIKGVISMSGAYNLKNLNMAIFGNALDQTFQGGYLNNDDELDEASPYNYLNPDEQFPKFFLIHCSFDLPSLPEQKILFKNSLALNDIAFEEAFLPGYSHVSEMAAIGNIDDAVTQQIINFIASNQTQTIEIGAGWSGISSFIDPTPDGFEDIFSEQIQDIQIIANTSGYFDPVNHVNTIGNWTPETGYMINILNPVEVLFSGHIVESLTPPLVSGWNLLPVWSKENIPVEDFQSTISDIKIIKEVAGVHLFWPEHGINTLHTLCPGKTYWLFLSTESDK